MPPPSKAKTGQGQRPNARTSTAPQRSDTAEDVSDSDTDGVDIESGDEGRRGRTRTRAGGRGGGETPQSEGGWDSDATATDNDAENPRGRRDLPTARQQSRRNVDDGSRSRPPSHRETDAPSPSGAEAQGRSKYDQWIESAQKRQREWDKRQSTWSGSCGDCGACWRGFWGWRGWRWGARNGPYFLALLMGLGGLTIAATGERLGIWMFDFQGGKWGGMGYCKKGNMGCVFEIAYDTPDVGSWPGKTLSILLLTYGFVGIIQLFFLITTLLWVRYRPLQNCFTCDIEAQRKSPKNDLKNRRVRSLRWFEKTMDLAALGFFVLTVTLAAWVDDSNANGDWGWDLAIFLAITPFIWFILRMTYRSRWAYQYSYSRHDKAQGKGQGWNSAKDGPPGIDDREDMLNSYVDCSGKETRKPRKQFQIREEDEG